MDGSFDVLQESVMSNAPESYSGRRDEESSRKTRNEHEGGELCPDDVWRPYNYDSRGQRELLGRWKNGAWVPYSDNDPMYD